MQGVWPRSGASLYKHLFSTPPPRKQSPCVELWGIWKGFGGGHGCYRNTMLPVRLINRLKLSHKSLCHWLLCFDCILLVRWWCQVRTIIMLVMYFVIASAGCILNIFQDKGLARTFFWPWNLSFFTSYTVLNFSVKNWINFVCLLFWLNTLRNCCVTTFQILSLSCLSCVTVCFVFVFILFSPGGASVTHGWWTEPTRFIRSRVSS